MTKSQLIYYSALLILTAGFCTAIFIHKTARAEENLSIGDKEFSCDDRSCKYSATVSNNGNERFSGYLQIFGYKRNNLKRSLVIKNYKFIKVAPADTLLVSQSFPIISKPEQLEYSLRRIEYSGWLGSCDDGIFIFDTENMKYTEYEQFRLLDRPWEYRIKEAVIEKRLDDQYEVIFKDNAYNFLFNYAPNAFQIDVYFPSENRRGYFPPAISKRRIKLLEKL